MSVAAGIDLSAGAIVAEPPRDALRAKLDRKPGITGTALFGVVLAAGGIYIAARLTTDLEHARSLTAGALGLLGIALVIALGFEFVNGFHDTANAVATVIYTNSLEPRTAVVWSGVWNFVGVLMSTGGVAYGIISLLPVELILQVGPGAGFAMVFALLTSAILWNLGTWYFGLPSSSSHTLIGSIIGVGLANEALAHRGATSGVDWSQAEKIGKSLLLSPVAGFAGAALVLVIAKLLLRNQLLYKAPDGTKPPPLWVRSLLILTCTGVSFAHGSNDGQKGMGLIMLILVGTVPSAYAVNHQFTAQQTSVFVQSSTAAAEAFAKYVPPTVAATQDPTAVVMDAVRNRAVPPAVLPALRQVIADIGRTLKTYGSVSKIPEEQVRPLRNQMYLVSEAMRLVLKSDRVHFAKADAAALKRYEKQIDALTKFIPTWVKIAVAIALGLGTMIGWKRIVITIGERIGKEHLTYGQGAAAELTAMTTILLADAYGLPVSTTHVLSSGVAGTMVANRSHLQWTTVRNLALAWVLTLPASIGLAGALFWAFTRLL